MKSYIKNLLAKTKATALAYLAFMALICCACDFTEVDLPPSQLVSDGVFKDRATANAAMANIYAGMRDRGMLTGNAAGLSFLLGNYTDELVFFGNPQNGAASFYNNAVVQSNPDIRQLWNDTYSQIYMANAVIEGVAASQYLEDSDKQALTGEALFVRALLHLYLTGLFGDVPYVTTTDYRQNTHIAKSPSEQVYSSVINDLEQALVMLPSEYSSTDRTRPNKFAAYALLARAYLYNGDWNTAAEYASAVINNNALYSYNMAIEDTFLKDSPSTIWQMSPSSYGSNTREGVTFIFESGPPPLSALATEFVDSFEFGDLRKEYWMREISDGMNSWYHPYKYKQNSDTGSSVEFSVVLRLAEMYLIRAEARVRLGELIAGAEDLNRIRNKAGLTNSEAASQQELMQAILDERKHELFTEFGHRFFDLRRFGVISEVLSTVKNGWESYEEYLPLPEAELNLNPNMLPQNPGY